MSTLLNTKADGLSPKRLGRYALYTVGAVFLLYVAVQALSAGSSPTAAPAEEPSSEVAVPASEPTSQSTGIDVFTWGNLAALLLLAGGGGYALYLRQEGTTSTRDPKLRSVGTLALGQSKQLRLVACADEVLLLGVTDEEVSLLKSYSTKAFDTPDPSADVEDATALPDAAPNGAPPMEAEFSDVLDRFVQ